MTVSPKTNHAKKVQRHVDECVQVCEDAAEAMRAAHAEHERTADVYLRASRQLDAARLDLTQDVTP